MSSLLKRVLERRETMMRKRRKMKTRTKRRRRRSEALEKIQHASSTPDPRIRRFTEWCHEYGIYIHENLRIGREGSCADVGVVAVSDIPHGTVVARIPRSALLSAGNSRVAAAISQDRLFQRQLRSLNSWVPLLLALLTEKQLQKSGFWWPYLSLVPSKVSPGPALRWTLEERSRLLRGTGVVERVECDMASIERDFESVVLPFMQRHPELYHPSSHSLQLYKELVCFVMSYSFTDSEEEEADVTNQTMMVPFVDLLNHHSQHHVELSFHSSHLELIAVRNISQGSEVMNTYGPLSNASLVHVYGFAEEGNPHDVALIRNSVIKEVYHQRSCDVSCDQRWEAVSEDISDDEFEVNTHGHPEQSLIAYVKLLMADKKRYPRLRDRLLRDDGEELEMNSLSEVERKFLLEVCRASQRSLRHGGVMDKAASCNEKERFAHLLASSQLKCLMNMELNLTHHTTK